MKKLLFLTVVFAVLGTGAYVLRQSDKQASKAQLDTKPAKTNTTSPNPNTPGTPNTIRLIASGDAIPHDAINKAAKKTDGSYDYAPMMADMKPLFERADIRFCNQATPAGGNQFPITGYPVFNAPWDWSRDLAGAGCNLINVGSNHSNDKGQAVIDGTRNGWDQQKNILAIAGANRSAAEQQQIASFTVKGVKFAFLSFVTYNNTRDYTSYGVNMFNRETAKSQLASARQVADVVIVSMRWGTEYSPGINAEQAADGQFLADNGADIVLGHGPHVLGPVKKLAGQNGRATYVWYSLGNFLNAQIETEALFSGLAVMDIDVESKAVTSIGFLPLYMHYEWTAEQAARQDLLARSNFKLYALDDAAAPVATSSQLKTTVEAQRSRIQTLLNSYTAIPLFSKNEFSK